MAVDSRLYYIGAIAPDGIHARPGATRDDKRRVHLASTEEQPLSERLHSIQEFWTAHEHLVDASLLTGWVTHLVTDSIWSRHLVRGVWAEATQGWSHEQRTRRYYDEADKVDFILYRTAPWRRHVWESVADRIIPDAADLLTSEEITAWRDRLLRWFTELKEEPNVELSVITMNRVRRFVDICVTLLSYGLNSTLSDALDAVPGISGHELLRADDPVHRNMRPRLGRKL